MSVTTHHRKAGLWISIAVLAMGAATAATVALQQQTPARAADVPAAGALQDLQSGFTSIAARLEPSVVSISAERASRTAAMDIPDIFRNWPFGSPDISPRRNVPRTQTVGGSGVIVRPDGYILTNDHVVGGAESVMVTLNDGTEYPGKVMRDYATDLAVVKIEASNLPAAPLGDSSQVKPGAWAIAIGSPLGFSNTLTVGVVSATEREMSIPDSDGPGRYYASLIQTDASINPGNSGGPLLDLKGQIIGINVAIASPTGSSVGLGFAIPSNTAKFVLDQLVAHGKVNRGFLGLVPTDLTPAQAKEYGIQNGAFVKSVTDGTPAAEAGIQVEDVIVEFNGQKIEGGLALRDAVARTTPGTESKLTLVRAKQRKTVTLTVGSPPNLIGDAEEAASSTDLGITTRSLNQELRQQYKLDDGVKGVIVSDVASGSNAERAGIRQGDVIQKVNGQNVQTPQEYSQAVSKVKPGETVRMVIRRGDAQSLVELKAP